MLVLLVYYVIITEERRKVPIWKVLKVVWRRVKNETWWDKMRNEELLVLEERETLARSHLEKRLSYREE